ncbi:MAG: hypothetical protein NTV58_16130, partial [Deltaproteobacteria bacterium]|nr:hypothetical protein [Deltaproteobacteria bacterium]
QNRYFTLPMLNHDCVIRKGISGLDPDKEDKQQVKKWMEEHPGIKPLSPDEEKARREKMKICRRHRTEKLPSEKKRVQTPFQNVPSSRNFDD